MYLQRLLAVNMATFAALGTILLSLGEQNPTLAVVAVLAAMAAVWVTDILALFRLNRRVTNVAVLLAVLRSLWELFQIQGAVQVIAIANLLAYVMIILLFQEKDFRTWWHIALLSLLQVAASATFFQGIWFAPLLLFYFFVGLCAVALLFLHHERTHYHQVRHHPIVPRETRTVSERLGVNWKRLGKMMLATFVVGPVSLFLDYGESEEKKRRRKHVRPKNPGDTRWPLIYDEPEFTGSADSLGGRAGIGLEFYRHLLGLIPGTLVVAIVLFMFIPRFGRLNLGMSHWGWNSARGSSGIRSTGFSDSVRLGEEGRLTEDPEELLRVRFVRANSEEVYPMHGKIYLRGAVLDTYEDGNFRDSRTPGSDSEERIRLDSNPRPGLVRQEVTIGPLQRRELFCLWPFVGVRRDDRMSLDRATERLLRRNPRRIESAPFVLGTYALVDGRQVACSPASRASDRDTLLMVPHNRLPTLVDLAAEWIQDSQLDENQVVERARYLESQFANSEQFFYSLDAQDRDPELDPIEDFVTERPGGHCEYFATALALMLRSQGIPARVVNGFVSNEYIAKEGYYRVRQRDAHSWVEAYIASEHLPAERPFGRTDVDWSRGGWLRLDPTPSRAGGGFTALVGNVKSWFERMQDAWREYVINMNGATQREAIYNPLKELFLQLKESLIDAHSWGELWTGLKKLPARLRELLADAGWFSWIGVTLLAGALGLGYALYRLARWLAHLLARLLPSGRGHVNRRSQIAFYRRLETLLARRGLHRRPAQTHREFAVDAGRFLADGESEHAKDAALLVTDAFYRVRFGGEHLDNVRMQRVEQALHDLEKTASGRAR